MSTTSRSRACASLAVAFCALVVAAPSPAQQSEVDVSVAAKPAIDGKLEDGCWKAAVLKMSAGATTGATTGGPAQPPHREVPDRVPSLSGAGLIGAHLPRRLP